MLQSPDPKSDRCRPAPADAVVIGAGPAGLTAALEFCRRDYRPLVLEKDVQVGGISKTTRYRGYYFDLGGHRFFSKSDYVNRFWRDILGDDFLLRPRLSRIYYQGRFFSYPPQLWNALAGLGPVESVKILISYAKAQIAPHRRPQTFEQWTSNAFGRRLFEIFFKSYTEKVWGISCQELRAEWAAQRIKGLSLKVVLKNLVLKSSNRVTTLIEQFHYPRRGPGMLWQAVADRVDATGGEVRMQAEVLAVKRGDDRVDAVVWRDAAGRHETPTAALVSSMPLTELIQKLEPPPPAEILAAAARLKYRSFLTVCLIVDQQDTFPDNWIYVHAPDVRVARIQNFKNWSPDMVPDRRMTSLGLEYFCNEGDQLWCRPDAELIAQGTRELERIGLIEPGRVRDGCVYRVPKAYPIYDAGYADSLTALRDYCDQFTNLYTVGRNGLHRYNNQDHSMLTGLYAVRNLNGEGDYDLWSVNTSQDYLEEKRSDAADRDSGCGYPATRAADARSGSTG